MGFEIDFEERLKKIFLEKIDDESEYDDEFAGELEPKERSDKSKFDIYGDDTEEAFDWTNIPNPKSGKEFQDFKELRVKGPPMIMTSEGPIPADPLVVKREDGKGYDRLHSLPHGGKITKNVVAKLDPELQKQYIPYTDEKDETTYKRTRGSIDIEFLIDENGDHWSFNEVVSALKPQILYDANKVNNAAFSKDDAVTPGMEGIWNSWMSDLGQAPFMYHAFQSIRVQMGDESSKSGLMSGKNTSKGGTRMAFDAQKGITSADAPVGGDESQGSFAGQIPGDERLKGKEIEKEQNNQVELLNTLFNSDEVGLNKNEKSVMGGTYGINKQGKSIRVVGTAELAKILAVSNVRVSQMRKSGLNKIMNYMKNKGYSSPEEAMTAFGILETRMIAAATIVIESMKDILELELELLQEYQQIPIDVIIGSVVRHAKAKVNSNTLSIDDVVAEGGESILGSTPNECIYEAKMMAATKLGKSYYAETVATIVQMHAVPVLAVIGGPEESEEESTDNE